MSKINIDYILAGDDSCQVMLYTRAHVDYVIFIKECNEFYLREFDAKIENVNNFSIKKTYWRDVPARSDNIVSDRQLIESKKGPGAFSVTVLDKWLPLHNY